MKKILLAVLLLIFSVNVCFALEDEEDVNNYFTDEDSQTQNTQLNGFVEYNQQSQPTNPEAVSLESVEKQQINFSQPQKIKSESLFPNNKKPTFQPLNDKLEAVSQFSGQTYSIKPVSTAYSQKFGKFKFGTMYDSGISSASVNYSTGIFSKYEGKHFALSTAFSKDTNINSDSFNDKIFVAPELKLTKNLSFLDIMQTDVNQINKGNNIVLRYSPHFKKYADDVQLEFGAGQSYYQDNYVSSSIHFSTRFKL